MKGTQSYLSIQPQLHEEKNIDRFSKLETSFLEKYFCQNLNDFFPDIFSNLYEDQLEQRVKSKAEKTVSARMYEVRANFIMEEFERKVEQLYGSNSVSIRNNELPFAFKFKYCNLEPMPNIVAEGELVYLAIKIKAEVASIEALAHKALLALEDFQERKARKTTEFEKLLRDYKGEYFNLFVVYFGDCNFHYFNKAQYHRKHVKLMGRHFKLRIMVFYVSKQALLESFCLLNKVSTSDYINDLMIQFYELKRQRSRQKRKRLALKGQRARLNKHRETIYTVAGALSLLAIGLIIVKMIHWFSFQHDVGVCSLS